MMIQTEQRVEEHKQHTILLADDDEVLLTIHKEVLEDMGYRVITASHGMQAIEQYKKHKHDISLAMFDVRMPHTSGPEAAACIANEDSALPFVFVTGCDLSEDLKAISIPQGFRIFTKPLNFEQFHGFLQETLTPETIGA